MATNRDRGSTSVAQPTQLKIRCIRVVQPICIQRTPGNLRKRGTINEMMGNGAGEAIRTPDPNLGKVVLYP